MSIQCYPLTAQQTLDIRALSNDVPTKLTVNVLKGETSREAHLRLPAGPTHFGFVWQGSVELKRAAQADGFPLSAGLYFSLAEAAVLRAQEGLCVVISQHNQQGQFTVGGPIETVRRFPYIDGGTTSLLVPPIVLGDPVLNALYMPPNVDQTVHTHPSDRIGLIIRGSGQCCGDSSCDDLLPGTLFHISANQAHRFVTTGQGLDLVVFHPDSDMGFSDRNHPMLSRTLVDNIRATELPEIQTTGHNVPSF